MSGKQIASGDEADHARRVIALHDQMTTIRASSSVRSSGTLAASSVGPSDGSTEQERF